MDMRRETLESYDGLELFSMSLHSNSPKAAVLFLHSIGEDSSMYESEMKLLKRDGYSLYSVDLRGHGRSPGPRNLWYSYEDTFEDLDIMIARIREREGIRVPIYLIGYGFGALLAASYISVQKQKVSGVILCGSTPKAELSILERKFKNSLSLVLPNHNVAIKDKLSSEAPIRTMIEVERLVENSELNAENFSSALFYLKWEEKKDVLDSFFFKSPSNEKEMVSIESGLRNNQRVETIRLINSWLNKRVKDRPSTL